MTRSALPQNFALTGVTLLEGFENIANWTVTGGTKEANTTQFKTGTQSLKLTVDSGSTNVEATKNISILLLPYKTLGLWVYCHDTSPNTTIASIYIYITSLTNWTKYFYIADSEFKHGWNLLRFSKVSFSNSSGDSWGSTMVRLRVKVNARTDQMPVVSFDSFEGGFLGLPKVCLTFDDIDATAYSEGYTYMNTKGLKGTFYAIQNRADTAGNMTTEQLNTAYAAGWAIANHTSDHTWLDTLATQPEIEAKISDCDDWLIANGWTRSAYHLAYPGGNYNDLVLAAVANLGMKTARSIIRRKQSMPYENIYTINCFSLINTDTLATVKSWISQAVSAEVTCFINFHKITAGAATQVEWSIANFQGLIDWLVEKKYDVLTIDEWYEGLTNPRYRSLPLGRATT